MRIFEKALIGGINKMMDAEEKLKEKTGIVFNEDDLRFNRSWWNIKKGTPREMGSQENIDRNIKGFIGCGILKVVFIYRGLYNSDKY